VDWQPVNTAPANKRVLICDHKGQVRIARLAVLRWYDDADTLIGRPVWWMPLPALPSEQSSEKPKPHRRKR
jgi:hypothetical protein